jgi:hypothetical protein
MPCRVTKEGNNMTKITNSTILKEILTELKEIKAKMEQKQEKPTGLHGIPEVMGGLMEAQKKHVEKMKEQDKKVECVECKKEIGMSICSYDPAMNRYICGDCEKEQELNKKLAEREKLDEEIMRMSDRDIERK